MFATLETERLVLRPFQREDAEALYAYAKNPNVGPHAGWKPHESEEESLRIIEELFLVNQTRAVIYKETETLIGTIALEPDKRRPEVASKELGYSLAEEFWGKGIMTEAAEAVIAYAFDYMKLEVLAICTSPVNERSTRVIEKCGFKYEGTERNCYRIFDGSLRDSKCFSLLRHEWKALG